MNEGKILRGKTIVVTGCASGIGLETARVIKLLGGQVIGVDINQCDHHVDEFHQADLSDKAAIEALVDNLPKAAMASPTSPACPPQDRPWRCSRSTWSASSILPN